MIPATLAVGVMVPLLLFSGLRVWRTVAGEQLCFKVLPCLPAQATAAFSASKSWWPALGDFGPCFHNTVRPYDRDMNENRVAPKAENLSPAQCWKLLSETSIGRLAVTVDGHPDVFPVNYLVDGESLIFRTGGGTKIDAIREDARVAVEADAVSAEFGLAWSVVVKGRAEIAVSDDEVLNATKQGMFPWQGVGKDHLVRIVAAEVTGKRFTLDASMTWRVPLNDAIRAGLE